MKRIVGITVDNYKAYVIPRNIAMPMGENVLLYGENGSGKSSLYKAIRYFLSSSVGIGNFELNKFSGRADGQVVLTYADIDAKTNNPIVGSERQFCISTDAMSTTNNEQFIQLSYRVSGFLDYTQLLRAYFAGGKRPDLFELVMDLISDYIPIKQGMKTSIMAESVGLLKELHSAYHRSDWAYKRGESRFNAWKSTFEELMKEMGKTLSMLMATYFKELNMNIKLTVPPITLKQGYRISEDWIDGHVFVDVDHYGLAMSDYNETLNEARLSAIAICLYLSSLKLRADNIESKILYLDDVFLGLDLGNRKPVLDILLNEFSDYQIFISTYDRGWYVQAKEILLDRGGWCCYELYEGTTETPSGHMIANPIVIKDDSSFDRACAYLNDNEHPDYQAAANYLRKAFEELLQKHFYEPAVREEQCELIPVFKLTHLVDACRGFVRQLTIFLYPLNILDNLLTELKNTLHPLLHPLSHYAPDVPVYKAEVIKAIRLYQQITAEVERAEFDLHCRVFQEKGRKCRLLLNGKSGWRYVYTIKLQEHLYLYDDHYGGRSLSKCSCRVTHIEEIIPGKSTARHQIDENDNLAKIMRYDSLESCHQMLVSFLASAEGKIDFISVPTWDSISFPDENNVLHSVNSLIPTFKW